MCSDKKKSKMAVDKTADAVNALHKTMVMLRQGLLYLDGRNSQKYLHQTWADF